MIVEFGVTPSEYWKMTPDEVNLVIESKRPKTIGGLHESDIDDMIMRREKLREQGIEVL